MKLCKVTTTLCALEDGKAPPSAGEVAPPSAGGKAAAPTFLSAAQRAKGGATVLIDIADEASRSRFIKHLAPRFSTAGRKGKTSKASKTSKAGKANKAGKAGKANKANKANKASKASKARKASKTGTK